MFDLILIAVILAEVKLILEALTELVKVIKK